MKQDIDTTPDKPAPSQTSKPAKPTKDLYKPYNTPSLLWHSLRMLALLLFPLVAHIRLRGRYNVPRSGPCIIAPNHLSWADIPLIPAYMPRKVVYMAKEETFKGRFGWLTRFMGAFPVKRGEADRQAIRAAEEQLKAGRVFVMFPEGTRSRSRTLGKGHPGLGMIALRTGAPVVPVAIWGSEHFLRKFRAEVNICYGEPMVFKPKGRKITREDIEDVTAQIMARIAAMLPEQYRGSYGAQPQGAVEPGSEEQLE